MFDVGAMCTSGQFARLNPLLSCPGHRTWIVQYQVSVPAEPPHWPKKGFLKMVLLTANSLQILNPKTSRSQNAILFLFFENISQY